MNGDFTVRITPESYPGAELTLPLGSEIPKPTGGTARWNKINRPRRRTMTEFDGEDPVELTFSVMLDQFPNGDVEALIGRIWGWSARNDLPFQPTILRLAGAVPFSGLPYVLTGVEEMDTVERRNDGIRCRQELKLTLMEYIAPDLIVQQTTPAVAAQQRAVETGSVFSAKDISDNPKLAIAYGVAYTGGIGTQQPRTYTVNKGDTLSKIAAKIYSNANKWPDIAKANNIRDPNRISIGQVLVLP